VLTRRKREVTGKKFSKQYEKSEAEEKMSSTDRCFFQFNCPGERVVRLKLAPYCPLLHLFQQ